MSAAQEHRYVKLLQEQADKRAADERWREVIRMDARGDYDHIKQAEEVRRQLDGALLNWRAPRPEDYATKAEALRVAKSRSPKHFPVRAYTPFESFWVVVYVTPEGQLGVGGNALDFRPATDGEAVTLRVRMNRTSAERPLYIVTPAR